MTKEEFDNLNADGRDFCPECGSNKPVSLDRLSECKNKCALKGVSFSGKGEGIRHINKYHHECK